MVATAVTSDIKTAQRSRHKAVEMSGNDDKLRSGLMPYVAARNAEGIGTCAQKHIAWISMAMPSLKSAVTQTLVAVKTDGSVVLAIGPPHDLVKAPAAIAPPVAIPSCEAFPVYAGKCHPIHSGMPLKPVLNRDTVFRRDGRGYAPFTRPRFGSNNALRNGSTLDTV